jgi:hypothetical protein
MSALGDFVDLDRYPIDALESRRGERLLAECRTGLTAIGAANLPGFLAPAAAARLAQEAIRLEPLAYRKNKTRNAYFTPDDPALPEDDPRRRFFPIALAQAAGDVIPPESGIARLYASDALTELVRRALDLPRLYRRADIFQNLNLIFLADGGVQPWHYDQNQFSVTLLLQAAEQGGDFEFVPNLRAPDDERFAEVGRLFRGEHPGIIRPPRAAGTLTLFRGEHSMHRVTTVRGGTPRITAIFAYDEEPGLWTPEEENVTIYGPRVREVMAARRAAGG